MSNIESARSALERGLPEEACRAYASAAADRALPAEDRLEAALFLLQAGEDYRVPYQCLLDLHAGGFMAGEVFGLLNEAFYLPNVREQKKLYRKNCGFLKKYPYIFQKDFPEFDRLPLSFFPFDNDTFIPYSGESEKFSEPFRPGEELIRHHFFRDTDKPVLAEGIVSQYELEYLEANVRPSEYCARENHIYLVYDRFDVFCAYLQVLDLGKLLKGQKFVFLFGEERNLYPLDFASRFGVDYSRMQPRPIGLREVQRMVWHVQLSTHNGCDFFNEIFDEHPNLLNRQSQMFDTVLEYIQTVKKALAVCGSREQFLHMTRMWDNPRLSNELFSLKSVTGKDILTAHYLAAYEKQLGSEYSARSRIAPALFFQPHFPNNDVVLRISGEGYAISESLCLKELERSGIMDDFPYIKAFIPMRRPTTSYGGSMRFAFNDSIYKNMNDVQQDFLLENCPWVQRVVNRTFMRDRRNRLFRDCTVVRFEDAKLEPQATFTALCAFLDLPYTDTMAYCSGGGVKDPYKELGDSNYAAGFSLTSVYKTYDEFANDSERCLMEYFMRDVYAFYGYDFHYYDGAEMTVRRMEALLADFQKEDSILREIHLNHWRRAFVRDMQREPGSEECAAMEDRAGKPILALRAQRDAVSHALLQGLRFISAFGEPTDFIPRLEPVPELMKKEPYR